jgi:hypothetical protein
MFSKKKVEKNIDIGDNFGGRKTTLFVRNVLFDISKDLGFKYFTQYDDDYQGFYYRYDEDLKYITSSPKIKNLDKMFNIFLKYYKSIPALSIAFAQTGDFIGGQYSKKNQNIRTVRKCMNTWICSTDRPFNFVSRMNDDVTTYSLLGHQGQLFLTPFDIVIKQPPTQAVAGGMTEVYKDLGTYTKSFYTLMYCPSFIKIALMGGVNKRLHHLTNWDRAVPAIISEEYRKRSQEKKTR